MNTMKTCSTILGASLIVALVAAPGLAQKPDRKSKPEPSKAVVVSFETLPSNHMLIKASVNDKEPGRFIFDLGAPVTLLGSKAAETAGIVDDDAPRLPIFGARGDSKIKSFRVGDAEVKDMPVMVMDHPAVAALADQIDQPIDGLIGYTFFARFRTTIDYQKKEMTLEPVDFEVKDLAQSLVGQLQAQLGGARPTAPKRFLAPVGYWGLVLEPTEGDDPGVQIAEVRDGSPAHEAGLKPGDRLTTIDGRWTTSVADAYDAAARVDLGKSSEVDITIQRNGQERSLKVKPRAGL